MPPSKSSANLSRNRPRYENKAAKDGFEIVIGVDEAGRGPLAGPVVASAVCLHRRKFLNKIADSKSISQIQREKAFHEIFKNAEVGIGIVNESAIDSINILNATYHAMTLAVNDLIRRLSKSKSLNNDFAKKVCLLIDGNSFKTDLPYSYKTIVKGDSSCLSIACASIIAKVTRDRILSSYDKIFPEYGFKRHKGYPTKAHRTAIAKHGLSIIHRKTFRHDL